MTKNIKNADIVMMGGNMTNVFFDMDRYKTAFTYKMLQNDLENKKDLTTFGNWYSKDMDEADEITSLSISAFNTLRKKNMVMTFEIHPIDIDDFLNKQTSSDIINQSKKTYAEIKKNVGGILKFNRIVVKFGSYGDMTFRSQIALRNVNITMDQYHQIIQFSREITRLLYADIVLEVATTYMKTIYESPKERYHLILIEKKKEETLDSALSYLENRNMYALTWIHMIYDDCEEAICAEFAQDIACGEENFTHTYISKYSEIKTYVGWSHTVMILPADKFNNKTFNMSYYVRPIEIKFSEWEFIIGINEQLNNFLFKAYDLFAAKKYFFKKTTAYKIKINRLLFFVERIIQSYDSAAITLNQFQTKMMQIHRDRWELNTYYEQYKNKKESLYKTIDYVIERKKSMQSKVLNGILFFIALFSIVDITNAIYIAVTEGDTRMLYFGSIPTVILICIVLYNKFAGD